MTNILILGSSGLIGKNLCKFLKQKKHTVIQFDLDMGNNYDLSSKEGKKTLENIIQSQNIDYIYFLAFDVGGSKYLQGINIPNYIQNNIAIMENVFSVIGNIPFVFASTQMENIYHPYGTLKRLGEHYTTHFNQISVRFWNVYGKESFGLKSHVITDIIYKAKTDNKITLLTNGNEERQFLHTSDCSEGLYKIMLNHHKIIKDTNIIHLTSYKWVKIIDIARIIANIYKCEIDYPEDNDKLQNIKNEPNNYFQKFWKPKISLLEGIKKCI